MSTELLVLVLDCFDTPVPLHSNKMVLPYAYKFAEKQNIQIQFSLGLPCSGLPPQQQHSSQRCQGEQHCKIFFISKEFNDLSNFPRTKAFPWVMTKCFSLAFIFFSYL